jgi:hypothetical protein
MNKHKISKQRETQNQELSIIINNWDPYGLIAGGAPKDEFESEVAQILDQLDGKKSLAAVTNIISKVFSKNFEPKWFTKDKCEEVANEVYQWWQSQTELQP